ncbi:MAG: EamA family transporter [Streptosporangiales bacterium]|nr:EamA family transporter [Streptosporangiales bacterium]
MLAVVTTAAGRGRRPTPTPQASFLDRIDARVLVVLGAGCISVSAILMKLSEASAPTASFYRCVLALPLLLPLVLAERRRWGVRAWRRQGVELVAGVLLGVDMVLWGLAIGRLGAGIATVVVNIQVVIVPLLALLVYRERVPRRFVLIVPVMLGGVALAAGALGGETATTGSAWWGAVFGVAAGAAYAGYLFLLRGRTAGGPRHQAQPVLAATVGAALASAALGPFAGGLDLTPGWQAVGWLAALAVSGQVCGWLLISAGLPRLQSNVGSTLLLLQPVLAVLFAIGLVGERPTAWQLLGCVVVIAGVWVTSARPRRPTDPVAAADADPAVGGTRDRATYT